ncbi:MAG: hypothetical protein ACE5J5_02200 [Candidatus Hydrothermarchaeales archaeon]
MGLGIVPLVSAGGMMDEFGFSKPLLTIAIIIGVISSLYAFVPSIKMKGGKIGTGLRLYSIGLLCIVLSLLSVTWASYSLGENAATIHDLFFIIGFLLIFLGTRNILKSFDV